MRRQLEERAASLLPSFVGDEGNEVVSEAIAKTLIIAYVRRRRGWVMESSPRRRVWRQQDLPRGILVAAPGSVNSRLGSAALDSFLLHPHMAQSAHQSAQATSSFISFAPAWLCESTASS